MGATRGMRFVLTTAGGLLLGGCASPAPDDSCYENLGACLLLGTAQTVAYVGAERFLDRHHDHQQHRDKKGKR